MEFLIVNICYFGNWKRKIIISCLLFPLILIKEYTLKKTVENTKDSKPIVLPRPTGCDVCQGFSQGPPQSGCGAQDSSAGRGAEASKFSLPCMGDRDSKLGGQVYREQWSWGQEAGQGVLIIGLGTLVREFNRCLSQLDLPVSCPDEQWHHSNIYVLHKMVIGEREREESVRIHSSSVHMLTAKWHFILTRVNIPHFSQASICHLTCT